MSRSVQRKVLVIATRAAACPELVEALRERAASEPTAFSLVVPATPSGWAWLADMFSGGSEAEGYVYSAVARYRAAGLEVESVRLGDPDPVAATMDAVNAEHYDEIVVSTLPHRLARLLRISLAHRLEGALGRPVVNIVGSQPDRPRRAVSGRSVYLDARGVARVRRLDELAATAGRRS
jgi:hypothetical protein